MIRRSGLFNAAWYLANNPDVTQKNVNPSIHYLRFGGFEGRDPSPDFSSDWYLNAYDDVRKTKLNPLVHYLRYGQKEERVVQSSRSSDVDSFDMSPVPTHIHNQLMSLGSCESKIFCIGYNKTGTTSIERALKDFGYKIGVQSEAELLMDDWAVRDFRRIVQYCKSAEAFQDLPFSVDFTYQVLDYEYPGSKFILTIRNNEDEWYESLIRFYKKIMRTDGIPTADDMKKFTYRGDGWFWRQEQNIFGIDETTVCDEVIYKAHYTNHNNRVLEYFKLRPNDLLVLNLSDSFAMRALCEFLGKEYTGQKMPHLNKSSEF